MEQIINKVKRENSLITIIEHTKESPFLFTKIIKSGIKNLYHVITEWKTEHVTHRMMRPIEIIESYPVTGFDLFEEKKKNQ
jgi:hypothetical protein